MRDPLPKHNGKGAFQHYSAGYAVPKNNSFGGNINNPMQVRRNKSDYCWNFNKGVPCKFGARCKFIERCKYCDSPSHGVNACIKLQKREGTNANRGQATGNNNTNNNNSGNVNSGLGGSK